MLATVRSILISARRFDVLMHKYKVTSSILAVVSRCIVMQASSVDWTHVLDLMPSHRPPHRTAQKRTHSRKVTRLSHDLYLSSGCPPVNPHIRRGLGTRAASAGK